MALAVPSRTLHRHMWDGALNWGARGGNAGWIGVATGAPIVCAGDNVAGDLKDGSGSGLVVESDVPCTGLAGRRRLRGVSSDRCDADAHNSPASISGTLHGVEAASRASPNCFRNVSHRCNTACFSRLAAASSLSGQRKESPKLTRECAKPQA